VTSLLGNGTQSIVWQINEETYRKSQELAVQREFTESQGYVPFAAW
jgi:hypothetical protein